MFRFPRFSDGERLFCCCCDSLDNSGDTTDLVSCVATQFDMGKQGFEMAAQVCAVDDCLWTKFLLDLSKF